MDLRRRFEPLWNPAEGFRRLAAEEPGLGASLKALLIWRLPLGLLQGWLSWRALEAAYLPLRELRGPLWEQIKPFMGEDALDQAQQMLQGLPALPPAAHVLPWLPPLALLSLLGLWFHDGVWDHAGLWLLRGLKPERQGRVRATLAAEAHALTAGAAGAAFGLLGFLPAVGGLFQVLGLALGVYLWILRGWALAAFHGCPAWKGVAATLLHLLLFGLFLGCCFFLPLLLMLRMPVG